MTLWSWFNRVMFLAAGLSVLAAVWAVSAWGQSTFMLSSGEQMRGSGNLLSSGDPTVSVASLRVPEEAWRHFDKASHAAAHQHAAEFERESMRALEIAPQFAEAHLLRAVVQTGTHSFDQAIASVQAALRCDPRARWASIILAGAYNGQHRYNEARLVLDAERGMEAQSWQATYERARSEIGLRNAQAALYWSGLAIATAPPEFSDVHLVRANALLLDRRLAEAVAQMELYLQSNSPQLHREEVLALSAAVTSATQTSSHGSAPSLLAAR